jgi:pimeloyl-ACP methyl ester carboxylesterase
MSPALRPVPIVFVPGIAGTRLAEPTGRKVWDPLPSGSLPAWNLARLRDPRPLVPCSTVDNLPRFVGRLSPREEAAARSILGFGGIVFDVGGRLLVQLAISSAFAAALAAHGRSPAIYAAGYDWRRSCSVSAVALRRLIARALRDTGASQAVLVAHSMGGLVSRWFCRFGAFGSVPASRAVAGLVLLGSPTYGAPQAYRFLKLTAGAIREMETEEGLRESEQFLGPLSGGGRDLVRSLPSVYELLPNRHWCARRPNWLRFDTAKAGIPDASNPARLYANSYAGLTDDPATAPTVRAHLAARTRFHSRLGAFMPRRTLAVFSTDRPTEAAYVLRESWPWGYSLDRPRPLDWGDGTVPALSAAAVGAHVGLRVPLSAGITHRDLPDHPAVVSAVMRSIVALIALPVITRELAGGIPAQ